MADNFDLKKFLKESKALENLNPSIKAVNEGEAAYEYEKGKQAGKREEMKAKIKEMIVAELSEEVTTDNADADDAALNADYDPVYEGEEVEEAKNKEADVEDVEVTDTDVEDVSMEDEMPAEEAPAADGGIEDLAADMKGTEADLMDHLMKAFQIAKGMQNEKLETQVGNTLKFFVSEYIGGGE